MRKSSTRVRRCLRNKLSCGELLERRVLLSVNVPLMIDPGAGQQIQFPPGSTEIGVDQSVQRDTHIFSLNGEASSEKATFRTIATGFADAAIAVYDRDGNLVAYADDDADPASHANEVLTVELQPSTKYLVSVINDNTQAADIVLEADIPEQVVATPIAVDTATGDAVFKTIAKSDLLDTLEDVNYHPLVLTNSAATGSVRVIADQLDTKTVTSVFRRENSLAPWRLVDSTKGSTLLHLSATTGKNLTDSEYMLAVTSSDLSWFVGSYSVEVDSGVLAPATIQLPPASSFSPDLIEPGVVGIQTQEAVDATKPLVSAFRAPASGEVQVEVSSNGVAPLVSLYDGSGKLVDVKSRTTPVNSSDPMTFSFLVNEGDLRVLRVGALDNSSGTVDAQIAMALTPIDVEVSTMAHLTGLTVDAVNDVQVFRANTAIGDVLAIDVRPMMANVPPSFAPSISVINENWKSPIVKQGNPGEPMTVWIDTSGSPGPFDIMLSHIGPSVAVQMQLGSISVPQELDIDDVTGGELDLNGDVTFTSTSSTFGHFEGHAFYNLASEIDGNTEMQITGSQALAAIYQESGGRFNLLEWTASDSDAMTLSRPLKGNRHYAIVTAPLSFSTPSPLTIDVLGPTQTGIGIGMVPSPPPEFPSQDVDAYGIQDDGDYADPTDQSNSWQAELNLRELTLENDYEQHLWRTLLPLNMLTDPTSALSITLEPKTNSSISVEVLRVDSPACADPACALTTITATNGTAQTVEIAASEVDPGDALLFRVRSLPNQLEDGIYSLTMIAPTKNPHPFEVTERHWRFVGENLFSVTDPYSSVVKGSRPDIVSFVGTPEEIPLSQLGNGTLQREFSAEGVPQVDIFKFRIPDHGQARVWTEVDTRFTNTNLRLYRRIDVSDGPATTSWLTPLALKDQIDSEELIELLPSFDWFPANRSEIDAQSIIHNTADIDLEPGGEFAYVVVKNEQGTAGTYHIHVDVDGVLPSYDAALPAIGTGQVSTEVQLTTVDVDYVRIQVPDYHSGEIGINARASANQWQITLFDDQGNRLSRNENSGRFVIRSGPQTVYARIQKLSGSGRSQDFTITTTLNNPKNTTSPPRTLPSNPVIRQLDLNQFGDGQFSETVSSRGGLYYRFTAGPGPLRVELAPTALAALRWGLYVDDQLVSWDETQFEQGQPVPDSLWTEVFVPGSSQSVRPPMFDLGIGAEIEASQAVRDELTQIASRRRFYGFEGSISRRTPHSYRNVVLYVEAVRSGGDFQLTIDSSLSKPMRNFELQIEPRNSSTSRLMSAGLWEKENDDVSDPVVESNEWTRLFVPDEASNVSLRISRFDFINLVSDFHYSVFDTGGSLVDSGDATLPVLGNPTVTIPLSNNVIGGESYYVQIAANAADAPPLRIRAAAIMPAGNKPDFAVRNFVPNQAVLRLDPDGNGTTSSREFRFWVGGAGTTKITARSAGVLERIELYRIHRFLIGEFPREEVVLVDYANNGVQSSSEIEWSGDLDPGVYLVRAVLSSRLSVDVEIDAPTPITDEIILDPNFGISALPGLIVSEPDYKRYPPFTVVPTNILPEFQQGLYRLKAPPGTIGMGSADVTTHRKGSEFRDDIAIVGLWRKDSDGQYGYVIDAQKSFINPVESNNGKLQNNEATVSVNDVVPGEEFFISVERNNLDAPFQISAAFPVPFSGTPDLVVLPLQLNPNQGETEVSVNVTNVGYAPAFPSNAHYRIQDKTKTLSLQWATAELKTALLGPFGSSIRHLAWDPVTTEDQVEYVVDVDDVIEELSEENNQANDIMSRVNPHAPQIVHFGLSDPDMDGMQDSASDPNGDTWGRYIQNVAGTDVKIVFEVKDLDDLIPGRDEIYQSKLIAASGAVHTFGSNHSYQQSFTPYTLPPTDGDHPNEFILYTKDVWGLESDHEIRRALVVPRPSWLTSSTPGVTGSIKFNKNTKEYEVRFENKLIDYEKTLNQMLSVNVPMIGKKKNQFLVSVGAEANVSLNPNTQIFVPVDATAKLVILGNTVFDEHYSSDDPQTSNFGLEANIAVDALTVEATSFFVGLRIEDVPVVDYQSPEIKLATYGVPGLASINANLLVDIFASMDAGVTVAFDANALTNPTSLQPLGLARPTYIGVNVNPSLTIEGEVELFGFLDIASLSGSVGVDLGFALGLDNDGSSPSEIVPFDDFFNELSFEMTAALTIGASAKIFGVEVWDYHWTSGPLFAVGDVYQWDDFDQDTASGALAAFPDLPVMGRDENNAPVAVPAPPEASSGATGSQLLGDVAERSEPKLALLDRDGLFVQTVDVGNHRTNLAFSRRRDGQWSRGLTTLAQPEHVINPQLAVFNGGRRRMAGVVVYQATDLPDLFAPNVTFDQFLNAQELRYRYYDGSSWQDEKILESNGRFDANPAMSFNENGEGVLAWTHNTSQSPLRNPASNEVFVSLWDANTLSWSSPFALTNDPGNLPVSDSRPAVHMADDGTATVVWLRNTDEASMSAAGTEIWHSQYRNGAWTVASQLSTIGLEDARISQLAIGSSGVDENRRERLDILAAMTNPTDTLDANGDARVESVLGHLSMWSDESNEPVPVQTIARGSTFSYLGFTPNGQEGLLAYWQQSDGNTTDLFGASLAAPSEGRMWSAPAKLTDGDVLEIAPSVAVDASANRGDSRLQVVYDQRVPIGSTLVIEEPGPDDSDGIPMAGGLSGRRLRMLPEIEFERDFSFRDVENAVIGMDAVGYGRIRNSGMAGAEVRIEFTRLEDRTLLASRNVVLSPGSSLDLVQAIPVAAGKQTIEARAVVINHDGMEMSSVDNNASRDVIVGMDDLTIDLLEVSGQPLAGATVPVVATIRNVGARNISTPFVVTLIEGTPGTLPTTANIVGDQVVTSIGSHQTKQVTFNWNVPSEASNIELTAFVDRKRTIGEAIELNNTAMVGVQVRSDLFVRQVTAQLANRSGIDNVNVVAEVSNGGNRTASGAVAELWWSRNDGPFEMLHQTTVPSLAPGQVRRLTFAAHGLAGDNRYRVSIVPDSVPTEQYRYNDFATTHMAIRGFADLVIAEAELTEGELKQGDPVDIKVTLANQGIDDAYSVKIEVFALGSQLQNTLVGSAIVPHVAPLSAVDILMPIDTTGLAGPTELTIVVDRREKVLEISDLNNSFLIDATFIPIDATEPCDLNRDGSCDVDDIDALHRQIRSGQYDRRFDVDGNGRLDEADSDDWLVELMQSIPGDTNLDRVFNSSDLILVFQAGEYEDDIIGNSTFIEGDWNGDGDFTSGDLIYAFQAGGYRLDARIMDLFAAARASEEALDDRRKLFRELKTD